MRPTLHLLLILQQPVGTPDAVMRRVVERSYEPLIDLVERFDDEVRCTMYCSGHVLEWLERHDEGVVDRVAALVGQGAVELLGGGFFDPLLPIVPWRDGLGQLEMTSGYLDRRMGVRPEGVWLTDLVWEPRLAEMLADAGASHTFVDERIVVRAGATEPIAGMYATEHVGRPLLVLPIDAGLSELLQQGKGRRAVKLMTRRARDTDQRLQFSAVVKAEAHDVEPGQEHPLLPVFGALSDRKAVRTAHPSRTVAKRRPRGRLYMQATSSLGRPLAQQHFLRYPEIDWIHKRMIEVSRRFAALERVMRNDGYRGLNKTVRPRRALFRGQAATVFDQRGTLYRPAIRDGIYRNLIACESEAHRLIRGDAPFLETSLRDVFATLENTVLLRNREVRAVLLLHHGGTLAALEHSPSHTALHNVMTRRREPWHDDADIDDDGPSEPDGFDAHTRASLHDRFLPADCDVRSWFSGAAERGDLRGRRYRLLAVQSKGHGENERVTVALGAEGNVSFAAGPIGISLVKRVAMNARNSRVVVRYDAEFDSPLPEDIAFACEFNWAAMPWLGKVGWHTDGDLEAPAVPDKGASTGPAARVVHTGCREVRMTHEGLGLDATIESNRTARVLRAPILTTDVSEGEVRERLQGVAAVLCVPLAAGTESLSWRLRISLRGPSTAPA